ncbi:MAG TPA: D-alanyl-D-alanine carboxypeptidase/D-alanyl-D-alanine-endopeptidase [Bryobacteraceae bacterium]|nr:D-alanyl-D-alanine carboxypeptidase/D-alanyl-D-alanine-endopeptidase [Bryobacteraceae bacterium]
MRPYVVALACVAAACPAADLDQRLDALTSETRALGFAGIQVVEATTGKILYSKNADRLFLPASNLKILTSALALERLRPDYRFTTRVVREASGNVVLVGSGDPSLSARAFPYNKEQPPAPPLQAIEQLADAIAAHGVERIDGDIVGDDRLFPWDPYPPSWTEDDTLRDYGAPVSALSLDDNTVTVSISPATLTLAPAFEYLTIDNRVRTAARGTESAVHARRVARSTQWQLTGAISSGRTVIEILPVDDPALFAASALYDALTRRGIAIHGRPVARHRALGEPYATAEGQELATRISPPLAELLQVMDILSVNLHAELLLREVGRVTRGEGSTAAGLAEMSAYLTGIGAQPGDWRLEDGSGLARNTLVTPRLLTHILAREAQSADGALWTSLLPAGGEDGTLSRRLCCMSGGRGIHAKTGTLSRALALSGYADSATHGQLAFSILVNDFQAPPAEVTAWIDKIATALLE